MSTMRLLLPFQHGVDRDAIEQAVRLAKGCEATLVALSILAVQSGRKVKSPRLDYVQQSKDFLVATKHLAKVWDVPVEPFEVVTQAVEQAINTVASDMQCEGMVLFVGGTRGVLLSGETIQYLMEAASCKLYVMRLPGSAKKPVSESLRGILARMINRSAAGKDEQARTRDVIAEEQAELVEA